MKLKVIYLFASVLGASATAVGVQPAFSDEAGINVDAERNACYVYLVRAKRANRQLRAGEISPAARRSFWIKYRDCLGGKDKNHLLPTEFKFR